MKVLLLFLAFSVVCGDDDFADFAFEDPVVKKHDELADFSFDEPDNEELPIVKTSYGLVRGMEYQESTNERRYAVFEGIPYAKAPLGDLRFQAPQPLDPWTGIFNASGLQEHCLQYDPFFENISGSEDCLYLNVFTPLLNPSARLPVMVFIHGGAFMYGAGFHFEPTNLMDYDMVVVTFNYRLGSLGFLSTGDTVIPGNAGLKDQVMVLRWVQENIKEFGGDPNKVVLTGSSAGAVSVHYHYLSPLARGTFSKGIAWSGSAFAPWAYMSKPARKAKQLSSLLDCPTATSQEIMDCLINKPGKDIVNATLKMFDWKFFMFSPFAPTTEATEVEGAFLTRHPHQATRDGFMYDVPLITSVTADEGLYPAAAYQKNPNEILPEIEERWSEIAHDIFQYQDTLPVKRRERVAAKIKEYYFKGEPVSNETYRNLVQAMGDRNFISGVGKLAEFHAAKSNNEVYMYRYNYSGERSFTFAFLWEYKNFGVSHADDLFHIFPAPFVSSSSTDSKKMTNALITMIYTFAKSGYPRVPGNSEWSPLSPTSPSLDYLEILSPTKFEMKSNSNFGNRAFWDSLGFNEDLNYKKVA